MYRLSIPESEKRKGLVWVEYPVFEDVDWWQIIGIAELAI